MNAFLRLLPIAVMAAILLSVVRSDTPAFAAEFTVNSTADTVDAVPGDGICADAGGACTLRAAVMEENEFPFVGTINIPAGNYVLTLPGVGEDDSRQGDIDVRGPFEIVGAGKGATFIDGGGLDRVFDMLGGAIALSGVTIRGGNPGETTGGGIRNSAELTLSNIEVTSNTSWGGGGISNYRIVNGLSINVSKNNVPRGGGGGISNVQELTLVDSTIDGNIASGEGGGIYSAGSLTVKHNKVSGNSAHTGGAIHNWWSNSQATITDTSITGNTAAFGGGVFNSGSLAVSQSTVDENVATSEGGGISNSPPLGTSLGSPTATITNSTIRGNVASLGGGGVLNEGAVTITSSTISSNSANYFGGGLANAGGDVLPGPHGSADLTNSTVSGNVGGGIGSGGGISVTNVTVAENDGAGLSVGPFGSARFTNSLLANNSDGDCQGGPAISSLGHNLDFDGTCHLSGIDDLSGVDPKLGPLADNGGPTLTHALQVFMNKAGTLVPGSPAIDAGDNAACPATDQRGLARPVDGDFQAGAICDIGAFEEAGVLFGDPPPPTPSPATLPQTGTGPSSDRSPAVFVAGVLLAAAASLAGAAVLRRRTRHWT